MVLMRNGSEYTTSPPPFEMARMGYPGCILACLARLARVIKMHRMAAGGAV